MGCIDMMNKYAELIVKKGVNLQKGQKLVVTADVECASLVKAIAKEAYKAGAQDVIAHYVDEDITRLSRPSPAGMIPALVRNFGRGEVLYW